MTHGTTKRIRARYNNMLIDAPVNYGAEIALFGKVGFNVLRRAAQEALKRLRGQKADQLATLRAKEMGLRLQDRRTGISQMVAALDGDTIVLERPIALPFDHDLQVRIQLGNGRSRVARISMTPLDEIGARFAYDCKTDAGRYTIERYVLDLAVVGPTRPAAHPTGSRQPIWLLRHTHWHRWQQWHSASHSFFPTSTWAAQSKLFCAS